MIAELLVADGDNKKYQAAQAAQITTRTAAAITNFGFFNVVVGPAGRLSAPGP